MSTQAFVISTIIVCILYLALLFRNKRYRLLIPSTVHTITWLITCILIFLTINGTIGNYSTSCFDPVNSYDFVAPFIFGIVISSIIGFRLAHIIVKNKSAVKECDEETHIEYVESILKRYHWILYLCLVVGLIMFYFLFSIAGFEDLEQFRRAAVTIERFDYGAIAQQVFGHIVILGTFYFTLIGYKHAYRGINLKEFFIGLLFLSAPNIAIAGRLWLVMSLLPYLVTYLWHSRRINSLIGKKDLRKIIYFVFAAFAFFGVFGQLRNQNSFNEEKFADKFLYYTDGSRMTNMVLSAFPEGSFPLEYGGSEFMSKWIESPMIERYLEYVSDDIGLSVTVQSSMPSLYYDFGYSGGIIMWGVFCFILESIILLFYYRRDIWGILLFMETARLLFFAPIFPVFSVEMPSFIWLVILYVFRKKLFCIKAKRSIISSKLDY